MFLLGVFLWPAVPAAGQDQSGGSLIIGTPETGAFPLIQFPLEAYDSQGNFLSDLKAADVAVNEDGQTLLIDQLKTTQNGLQLTVAVNTHPSMNIPVNGSTQYGEIQTALIDWIQKYPAPTLDDFSLATSTGLFLIRSTDPLQWETALQDYQPDLIRAQPNLVGLADALDLATDPLGRQEMKRAILFITPALSPALLSTLPDYTSRARQIGVRVYVWMVAPSDTAEVAPALRELATQSGGKFNLLTPGAARPDVESQLANLRKRYEVLYTSKIQDSGNHLLSVQMTIDKQPVVSNERTLRLTVLPPNPIFLSPPPQLNVQIAPDSSASAETPPTQEQVLLKILVEFPDQHQRDLKATRLYVNDRLVAENLQPPFDQFMWQLAGISESGQLTLRVEALDSLDISGSSLEVPVEVVVDQPQAALAAAGLSSNNLWIAVGAMLAGSALATVLVISGRKNKINWRRAAAERSRSKDSTTQPVPGQGNAGLQRKKGETPTNPRNAMKNTKSKPLPGDSPAPSPARLIALAENEQPLAGGAIPLSEEELTFGSDPQRAVQVLSSPCVDGLHARIFCNSAGEYFLADNNSVAGTWINYAPVNGHGARMEDGDLLHIGRITFRFEQLDSGHPRRVIQVIAPQSHQQN